MGEQRQAPSIQLYTFDCKWGSNDGTCRVHKAHLFYSSRWMVKCMAPDEPKLEQGKQLLGTVKSHGERSLVALTVIYFPNPQVCSNIYNLLLDTPPTTGKLTRLSACKHKHHRLGPSSLSVSYINNIYSRWKQRINRHKIEILFFIHLNILNDNMWVW